jgi:hypothetical protein
LVRNDFVENKVSREEYLRQKEQIERDIAHWQNYTTESSRLGARLAMAMDGIARIVRLWEASNAEDGRGLTASLFDEIVYDLDRQPIVVVRFKQWADEYLLIRGRLYVDENQDYLDERPSLDFAQR